MDRQHKLIPIKFFYSFGSSNLLSANGHTSTSGSTTLGPLNFFLWQVILHLIILHVLFLNLVLLNLVLLNLDFLDLVLLNLVFLNLVLLNLVLPCLVFLDLVLLHLVFFILYLFLRSLVLSFGPSKFGSTIFNIDIKRYSMNSVNGILNLCNSYSCRCSGIDDFFIFFTAKYINLLCKNL